MRTLASGSQRQRSATIGGMSDADTTAFIEYDSAPKGIIAGRVNMAAYAQWLDEHGYNVNLTVGGGL